MIDLNFLNFFQLQGEKDIHFLFKSTHLFDFDPLQEITMNLDDNKLILYLFYFISYLIIKDKICNYFIIENKKDFSYLSLS